MPALTRWFIKTALAYFVLALAAGAVLLAQPVLAWPPALAALQPVYFHLLMVGWVTQLIFGMVYWMFPKQSMERPRGSERLGWATYWLLNGGLALRAVAEPLAALRPNPVLGWALVVSAGLQLFGGWAFVANTWGRVKER